MKKKVAILLAFVMVATLCVIGITKSAYAREAQLYIELPTEIKKEQELKVNVVLDSDVNLYSIDAYISYDANLLEFVPENDIVTGADGVLEVKDAFGEETKAKTYEITFRTIETGEAYINLTEVYLVDYESLDYISVSPSENTFEIAVNENVAEDARLADLIVAPGDLTEEFNPNKLNYEMHIGLDVEMVGVTAIPADEESVVDLEMPEVFAEGENVIKITVTAPSGNINIYTIKVVKADWPEDASEEISEEVTEEITEEITEASTEVIEQPTDLQGTDTTENAVDENDTIIEIDAQPVDATTDADLSN